MNTLEILRNKTVTDTHGFVVIPQTVKIEGDTVPYLVFSTAGRDENLEFEFPFTSINKDVEIQENEFLLVDQYDDLESFFIEA